MKASRFERMNRHPVALTAKQRRFGAAAAVMLTVLLIMAALSPLGHAAETDVSADQVISPEVDCSALASPAFDFSAVPDAPTQVTTAKVITDHGAEFCHVTGYVAPQVHFDIKLPAKTWTGRYLQVGCGGNCGVIEQAPPTLAGGCAPLTNDQVAIATDNEGHWDERRGTLWARNAPALRLDFGYASEHKLAQAAKAIIHTYYGVWPTHAYFDGCSDGGREALLEAQRFPHDFDGILAGAPASNWTVLNGMDQVWLIHANMDDDGHQILGSDKLPALHKAVMQACADEDGLIADPRNCDFDPATLQCPTGTDNADCLTAAQVQVVRNLYMGPHSKADGDVHYFYPGGQPYGSELAWDGWLSVAPDKADNWPQNTFSYSVGILYLRDMAQRDNPDLADFQPFEHFAFDMAHYEKLQAMAGLYNATDPDLSAFREAGGKIILWQGWADQAIPPTGTVEYYKAVADAAGGFEASQQFSRLYMIPGQYHCALPPFGIGKPAIDLASADLLTALMNWVEDGQAPDSVTLPLAKPTDQLNQLVVAPLNPFTEPEGGAQGLNTRYAGHYVGAFESGDARWCQINDGQLECSVDRQSPIHYAGD